MASKKTAAGMELILAALKRNRNVSYAEVKAAADKKRVSVYPIMFGRAKALLGLVKVSPRGQGKAKRQKAAKRGPGRPPKAGNRGPGRPRKAGRGASSNGLAGLQELVDSVRQNERENQALRAVLERISTVIAGVK